MHGTVGNHARRKCATVYVDSPIYSLCTGGSKRGTDMPYRSLTEK